MAVPKRKTSSARQNKRRSNVWKLSAPALMKCPKCGEFKSPHRDVYKRQAVNMYAKRIIPCLDVNNGRVVKGTSFINLRDAGDPVEAAIAYDKQEADELVLLDITASEMCIRDRVKGLCAAESRNICVVAPCGKS